MPTPAVPLVGINAMVKVTFPVGGTEVTLKNAGWKLKPKNAVKEAPNTTDGMLRCAGLNDYEITVKGSVDNQAGQVPETNVTVGSIGTIKLYRDTTHYWLGTIIVSDFSEETGAEDLDEWEFTAKKQSGTLAPATYP